MKLVIGLTLLALPLLPVMARAQQTGPTEQPAPTARTVVPLWPNGAPGFEQRKDIPEQAASYWVKNVNNPSLTVFLPPKDKATGAAVILCPGGGFRELGFVPEGIAAAEYFNSIGVAAFALKYRLPREPGSVYNLTHPRQDGLRAMRLVRSRAAEWGIDPSRIGMVGFSAGGEVVSMTAFGDTAGDGNAPDPIDRISARPDFIVEIYPGGVGIPETLPPSAPPAFLLVANDDNGHVEPVLKILQLYRAAKAPVEVHVFAKGAHAFNMGTRSKLVTIKNWPQRLADWMADNNLLDPAVPAKGVR
jgi:acetyl esterase/lipase